MNEASRWRLALARQIGPLHAGHPGVQAVGVTGSVARGWADRYSDIELLVFWSVPPSEAERRWGVERAGGMNYRSGPFNERIGFWEDAYSVQGVKIDLNHSTVATIQRILSDVLDRHDPAGPGQNTLASLQDVIPLHGEALLERWRARAAEYPPELARATVEAHLRRSPLGLAALLAERDDFITFRYNLSMLARELVLVLAGLNRIYDPGHKWVRHLIERFEIAPHDFAGRLRALLQAEPRQAIEPLGTLVDDVFTLVERHLPEVDTTAARVRFREPLPSWDAPPGE